MYQNRLKQEHSNQQISTIVIIGISKNVNFEISDHISEIIARKHLNQKKVKAENQ
jgi:hypothetical protein